MAALVQRQLPNLLSGILPFPHQTRTTDSTGSAGLTTSESITSTDSISSSSSVSSTTTTPASSTVSASSTIESSATSSSSTFTSSTSETPSATPSPSPTPAEATSADGSTYNVTVTPTASPSPSIQAAPANTTNDFLQNKTLSGIVFAIVGVVALVLIVAIATIALRRSRRRRLHDEAVSFKPSSLGGSRLDRESVEKRRFSLLSSDNGYGSFGNNSGGHPPGLSAAAAYTPQDPYEFPAAESQHNLIGNSQQPWYGGAGVNNSYGATRAPAWMYGNNLAPVPPSKTPIPSDRTKTPDGAPYLQAGNLQITNA